VGSLAPLFLAPGSRWLPFPKGSRWGPGKKLTEQMSYFLDKSALGGREQHRAEGVATKQGFPGDKYWNLARAFRRRRPLWPVAKCAQHYLGVKAKPGAGIAGFIHSRFLSFAMVASVCFLLLVALVLESVLKSFSHYV